MSENINRELSLIYSESDFKTAIRDCNGVCTLCGVVSYATAEPLAENYYCAECGNRTLVGFEKARQLGLVIVFANGEKG